MDLLQKIVRVSPNTVKQLLTRARKVSRLTRGTYNAEIVFESMLHAQYQHQENMRSDKIEQHRQKWG